MAIRKLQRSFVGGEMSPVMFGRPDDLRFQHGAARLQNFIATPQGPAQKRPGLRFVRAVKDSANATRLLTFRFSQDDAIALEMGTDEVASRDIGYFRMHTGAGTVLYQLPPAYVASNTITGCNPANDQFDTASAHGLVTGDPIVLTMHPTSQALDNPPFTSGTPGVVNLTSHTLLAGTQIMFEAQGGGALPPELEPRKLYYLANPVTDAFEVSETRGGPSLSFSSGGTATVNVAAMPHGVTTNIDAGVTYYIILIDSDTFELAATIEDALAGTSIDFNESGTFTGSDGRVHFDYQVGALVSDGGQSFYCFRRPADVEHWLPYLTEDTHGGYPNTNTRFWVTLPGVYSTVTFDVPNDEVDWTSHGLADGTEVIFSTTDTLPTGITAGQVYYVKNLSPPAANSFQVSASPGGAAITLSGTPVGTHTALAGSVFEIPHFFTEEVLHEVTYAQSLDVMTLAHRSRPAWEIRRRGATDWEVREVAFNSLPAPTGVTVTPTFGAGIGVASVTAATPAVITTSELHTLGSVGAVLTIYVHNVGDIENGFYQGEITGTAAIEVHALADRGNVASGTTALGANPAIFPGSATSDIEQTYVVTAFDDDGTESPTSEEVAVDNFMLAEGAANTITWTAVPGAVRYHIYKKEDGIFAYIGKVEATDALSFVDDNIGPDASRAAPFVDDGLRKIALVTFDTTNQRVLWTGHGLPNGTPIIFRSTGTLPTAITPYATYYVSNARDDNFELVGNDGLMMSMTGVDTEEIHEATAGDFPGAVAYFEQRRVFGGSIISRQRVHMTRSGTESDMTYRIPTVASDRIKFDLAARESSAIRHILPLSHLMILSASTEFRVTPINDDALTPESISVRPQSFVGTATTQPAVVHNVGIFAAARGGHVREMGFQQDFLSYLTGDLSLRATHLFDGFSITQISYSKAPIPLLGFVSSRSASEGWLLGMTYAPEEQIGAWARLIVTDGIIESAASVPEGNEDHVYVIVKRNINSADVRHVERMEAQDFGGSIADAFFVDSGVILTGASATIFAPHLVGEEVHALVDGLIQGPFTVPASGYVTLTTAATAKVSLGKLYTARIDTLPISLEIQAAGYGIPKAVNKAWIRAENSGAFLAGPLGGSLVNSLIPAAGSLLSGYADILLPPSWSDDGQIQIEQESPLPLTIVSVTYEVETGG